MIFSILVPLGMPLCVCVCKKERERKNKREEEWTSVWWSCIRRKLKAYVSLSVTSDSSTTPQTVAHQAPLSVGFPRQEYWSGLPCRFPGNLPNPGIEPRSPTLRADSLPAEPQGKPKNTGVGCCFLLQGIFPAQGSNPGLPHCRQTLYHLSHQGIPSISWSFSATLYCYL